jgi:protoheme IX farnesyltransferase
MRRLVVTEATGALSVEESIDVRDADVRDKDAADLRRAHKPITAVDKIKAYVALTKPRIIELLLVTTVPSMIVAARGMPPLALILNTLIGGALAAGGANAINCYIDRDIDRVMHRTRRRPLPAHKIEPRNAMVFGIALGLVSFAFLVLTVNVLSAVLAIAALLFYVFVYTLALKRSTPQNIVIGGAAGAVPALVGWSAVTGRVEAPAIALFFIIFYWTPPHFWALSMRYQGEYAAAGVPMMPVVYGRNETAKHILLYSLLLFATCLVFFSIGRMGLVFLGSALVLNGVFVGLAVKLWRNPATRTAWDLFRYSIYYLALLFAAMAIDQLIVL